jgi:uncharacterized protein YqfB (UPF0267 family)
MEIQLPEAQSYLDNIRNGSITEIRLPKMETETGEVLTAFSSAGNSYTIKLKVLSSETVPLEAITAEEAEQEGFAVPDFCASQFICGNIETRMDFEDYAFRHEDGVTIPRTEAEREQLLREKVERLCPSCITRKNAKDLFLHYWKPKVPDGTMTKIKFEVLN